MHRAQVKPLFKKKNWQLRLVTNIQEINQHANKYKMATKTYKKYLLFTIWKSVIKNTKKSLKNLWYLSLRRFGFEDNPSMPRSLFSCGRSLIILSTNNQKSHSFFKTQSQTTNKGVSFVQQLQRKTTDSLSKCCVWKTPNYELLA